MLIERTLDTPPDVRRQILRLGCNPLQKLGRLVLFDWVELIHASLGPNELMEVASVLLECWTVPQHGQGVTPASCKNSAPSDPQGLHVHSPSSPAICTIGLEEYFRLFLSSISMARFPSEICNIFRPKTVVHALPPFTHSVLRRLYRSTALTVFTA